MRFVWAVAAFVVAAVMIGVGIAQRTVWHAERSVQVEVTAAQSAPFTLIDGTVLNSEAGTQAVQAGGATSTFLSYGRTADLVAWLGGADYNAVTLDEDGGVVTTFVPASVPDGVDPAVIDHTPDGSDLWLGEVREDGAVDAKLQLPDAMSVLVAADGAAPAPSTITLEWPKQTSAPWSGPLIVGGSIAVLAGIILYLLAIRHNRRSRGPRRKGPPPLPKTEPIDLAELPEDADAPVETGSSRRSIRGRRAFTAIPVALATALVATGCSADAWPQFGATPTPTPTATVVAPANQQQPAVTQEQAAQIIADIAATTAEADAAMDAGLAATRLGGPVLSTRQTNYRLRAALPDVAAPAAIPSSPVQIMLPQAYNGWRRTVMAVVEDGADTEAAPRIMFLAQENPWSDYKLVFLGDLEASASLPDLAPAYVGAAQVPPDSSFLVLPPNQVAAAYADILVNGEQSPSYGLFDAASDRLRVSVAEDRQRRLDEFNETASTTGTLSFGSSAGTDAPIALATVESGAIVAVTVDETDTVKPTSADAVIKFDGNPQVKTLTGAEQSSTGVTSTYSDQLFFYVPGQGSTEKIRLLGYKTGILDAKVIP